MKGQIDVLYKAIQKFNKHFWPAFVNPDDDLTGVCELPDTPSLGSPEEMKLLLQYNLDTWAETPGAIDFIMEKVQDDI